MNASNHQAAQAKLAQGVAVALLAAVGAALLLAYLVHRLHGGPYIPIVIPALCGAALGGLIAIVKARFRVTEARVGGLVCALAAFVFTLGFQALVYLRSLDVMGSDPQAAATLIAEAGGGGGWWGFLTWTSTTDIGAELSPLGLVGRMKIGPAMTLAIIAVELLVVVGVAFRFERRKTRQLNLPATPAGSPPTRERIAEGIHPEALLAALQAVDSGDFEAAAQALGRSDGGPHQVYLTWLPHSSEPWTLEVTEAAEDGSETCRATRQVSSWDGQTLLDERRLAQSA